MKATHILFLVLTISSFSLSAKTTCSLDLKEESHFIGLVPHCCLTQYFLPVFEKKCLNYVSYPLSFQLKVSNE